MRGGLVYRPHSCRKKFQSDLFMPAVTVGLCGRKPCRQSEQGLVLAELGQQGPHNVYPDGGARTAAWPCRWTSHCEFARGRGTPLWCKGYMGPAIREHRGDRCSERGRSLSDDKDNDFIVLCNDKVEYTGKHSNTHIDIKGASPVE